MERFTHLIECMKVRYWDSISLANIIKLFKNKGILFDSHMFLYFSNSQQIYIYCGSTFDPIKGIIPLEDVSNYTVKLRCRKASCSITKEIKIPKKAKEKTIGEVIIRVSEWRKLYSGVTDYNGNFIKLSLEEAAMKVGIPKKTLDDYLLQLRFGKKYGFDFNLYKDENVGILRTFVKEKKSLIGMHQ